MYQIDSSGIATALPAPASARTPGFFTAGNPATSTPATILDADWFNAIMLELLNVLAAAGITPAKGTNNQVAASIAALVGAKTNGKAGWVQQIFTPANNQVNTKTFSFVAPSNGIVWAQQNLNISGPSGTPSSYSNTVSINGSSTSNDSTVYPMANTAALFVAAGTVVTINGTLTAGATGTTVSVSQILSYIFVPSN